LAMMAWGMDLQHRAVESSGKPLRKTNTKITKVRNLRNKMEVKVAQVVQSQITNFLYTKTLSESSPC
jgi:hypothetical protein